MPFHPRQPPFAQTRRSPSHAMIKMPGRPPLPCVIEDLSHGGATLRCDVPRSLPYQFQLIIEATKTLIACEARACDATSIGVTFVKRGAA